MVAQKKRGIQLIECMRLLCSILILFIHTGFPLPPSVKSYAVAVSRFAVPFMILLSGWFADHSGDTGKAKKKLKDMVYIVLLGGGICLLWNCINSFLSTGSFTDWILAYASRRTVFNFLVFNRAVFLNPVFYYFLMMIYVYCVFIATQKTRLTNIVCLIFPILLICLIYICEFSRFPWYYGGNFFFLGLPVFFLGYTLRKYRDRLHGLKSKEWIFITLGVLCTILERRLSGGRYIYIGAIITAVFLLLLCVNHEELECPKSLVHMGTFLAPPIVIVHYEILNTLKILTEFGPYLLPLMVLVLSLAVTIIYQKMTIRRRT